MHITYFFGSEVELHGNLAAATGRTNSPSVNIFVYLFDLTDPENPVERSSITSAFQSFGFGSGALSIQGDLLAIGDLIAPDVGGAGGAVDLFNISDLGNPVLSKRITANDGSANAFFGSAVELSGDLLLVGAYWDDSN